MIELFLSSKNLATHIVKVEIHLITIGEFFHELS